MWYVLRTLSEVTEPVVQWQLASRVEGIEQRHDAQSEMEALEAVEPKHRFFLVQMNTPVVWPRG